MIKRYCSVCMYVICILFRLLVDVLNDLESLVGSTLCRAFTAISQ